LDRFPKGTFAGLARVMVEQEKDMESALTDARNAEDAKKAAEAMRSKADEAKRLDE
jgi:hypothetical protein